MPVFYTYAGNDSVDGSLGDDYISVGAGMDLVYGDDGDEQIFGGSEADILYGELGEDTIRGEGGDDTIIGGLEDDLLYGGDGNDTFRVDGAGGWDSFDGGSGTDTILLDVLSPYQLWGAICIDFLSGVERVINQHLVKDVFIYADGSLDLTDVEVDEIDKIIGGPGDDAIDGTSNPASQSINDFIVGAEGNDILCGGLGNDTLQGDEGSDRYVFKPDGSTDVVKGFENGSDLIDLRLTSAEDMSDIRKNAYQDGVGTRIVVDNTIIRLDEFLSYNLDASDFLF